MERREPQLLHEVGPNHNDGAAAAGVADAEDPDEDMQDEDDEEDLEAAAADADIHVALDEILGLRGLYHLLRNSLWLLTFNGLYIGTFFVLPGIIGIASIRTLTSSSAVTTAQAFISSAAFQPIFQSLYNVIVTSSINAFIQKVLSQSSASDSALQATDIVIIVAGYSTILTTIFLLNDLTERLAKTFRRFVTDHVFLRVFHSAVKKLSGVVKVGLLLILRVFLLPLLLGIAMLLCINSFLGMSGDQWADFVSSNLMGALSLCWVTGISYMVSTTLSVLQLREILHPAILAKFIRPQEPHLDLLHSLMTESVLTHFRRIVASLLVYFSLLFLFVYLPMSLARAALEASLPSHIAAQYQAKLHFCYFIPQLQVPFELALTHLSFLTLLDKRKNAIGRFLHSWLVFCCGALGLVPYLLPLPIRKQQRNPDNSISLVVGPPLKRPPPGWDARTNRTTTRWAWGTEAPGPLERTVAPQQRPPMVLLRVLLLLAASWGILAGAGLFFAFVPLLLGRQLLASMQFPHWMLHDPICFVLGCMLCSLLRSAVPATLAPRRRLQLLAAYLRSVRSMPRPVFVIGSKMAACWISAELAVGFIIQAYFFEDAFDLSRIMSLRFFFEIYIKGSTLLSVFIIFVYSGQAETVINLFRSDDEVGEFPENPLRAWADRHVFSDAVLLDWCSVVRQVLAQPFTSLSTGIWDNESERINILFRLLVLPVFHYAAVQGLLVGLLSVTGGIVAAVTFIRDRPSLHFLLSNPLFFEYDTKGLTVATARGAISLLLLRLLYPLAVIVGHKIIKHSYKAVLNERFLVGRQLVNMASNKESPSQR